MKKLLFTSIAVLTLSSTLYANDWEILPVLNSEHNLAPSIAILGGGVLLDNEDSKTESLYGLEVGLNCPLIKVPGGKIRQQIQITKFEDNNVEITEVTLNPHYEFYSSDAFALGMGPNFGVAKVETSNDNDTVFTYGFGANVRANITKELFVGAQVSYETSNDATLSNVSTNIDNIKYFAKIGYQF